MSSIADKKEDVGIEEDDDDKKVPSIAEKKEEVGIDKDDRK
jgi:hypothetical protein